MVSKLQTSELRHTPIREVFFLILIRFLWMQGVLFIEKSTGKRLMA